MGQCSSRSSYEFQEYKSVRALETKSQLVSLLSSPSCLSPEDLTTVYKVPSENYHCEDDVLREKGIVIGKKLDEGGFSTVYMAKGQPRDVPLACKIIYIQDNAKQQLVDIKNELFILQKIKHPYIVNLEQHFIINQRLYILLEFADQGNMMDFVIKTGAFPEELTKKPFSQVVSGVSYMHALKIAHRDLKLTNLLVKTVDGEGNLQILITDFGLSRVVYRRVRGMMECKSFCGTPRYMAPEQRQGQAYNAFTVDIYALGVILFAILHCSFPYNDQTYEVALQEAMTRKIHWKESIKLSEQVRELIIQLLEPRWEKRLSMRELVAHLWYHDEMELIKDTLPSLDDLPRGPTVRRMSAPIDDLRCHSGSLVNKVRSPGLRTRSLGEPSKSPDLSIAGKPKSLTVKSRTPSSARPKSRDSVRTKPKSRDSILTRPKSRLAPLNLSLCLTRSSNRAAEKSNISKRSNVFKSQLLTSLSKRSQDEPNQN